MIFPIGHEQIDEAIRGGVMLMTPSHMNMAAIRPVWFIYKVPA
jgi:hypothetical protein